MPWLNLSDTTVKQLLGLCLKHKPKLYEEFLRELKNNQPEEPWQNQPAAVRFSRSRWSHEESDIEIDDDAALSTAENGVWIQGWLWVDRDDLEKVLTEEVHES